MARRRNRRSSNSSRSRRGKKKGGNSKVIVLAAAGLIGLGYMTKERFTGGNPDVALATTTETSPLNQEEALPGPNGKLASPTSPTGKPTKAPPELLRAFTRLGEAGLQPLIDLRRIVWEHAGTPEAVRASEALERERKRWHSQAKQLSIDVNKRQAALRAMTLAYFATVDPKQRRALRGELEPLSKDVFFGSRIVRSELTGSYTVKSGDSLSKIARTCKSSYRLIQRLNNMSSDRIRIGQRLRIPKKPITVVIFKKDFELVALLGDHIMATFDVATGANNRTPEGAFTIATKLVEPDWYSPGGKLYKYGTKENILGTRWLGFENTPEHQGYGIHGTSFPESIGTEASMGCIRVRNHDVEVLYDLIPMGAKIRIIR